VPKLRKCLEGGTYRDGRTGVIAFDGGFHGRTLATVNLNGKVAPYKQGLGNLFSSVYHIGYPSQDNGIATQDAKKPWCDCSKSKSILKISLRSF
jgi:4-aminobutyrate aminotransferase-like enzyme